MRRIVLALGLLMMPCVAHAEEMVIDGPQGPLKGTLMMPADVSEPPTAIIIPGSGPTDRDGNSPLGIRAASLRLLAEALGTPRIDARLQEMSFGDWEGRRFDDIGSAIDAWADDPLVFRAPGCESAREMGARALSWLSDLQAAPPSPEPVVVVAHGGPLRVIAGHLLGLPAERWLGLDFACGKATRIDVEDWGASLKWFNR